MTHLESLTKKLHVLLPELLELRFGCKVASTIGGIWTITHRHTIGNIKECWGTANSRQGSLLMDEEIKEILGHPITLDAIFKALMNLEMYDMQMVQRVLLMWIFLLPLHDQSPETIKFLDDLIPEQKTV